MAKAIKLSFDRSSGIFSLDASSLALLKAEFPSANVPQELDRMAAWLLSPKGTGRKGTLAFVRSWLARTPTRLKAPEYDTTPAPEIVPLVNSYLEKLWQNREHILQLNTISR